MPITHKWLRWKDKNIPQRKATTKITQPNWTNSLNNRWVQPTIKKTKIDLTRLLWIKVTPLGSVWPEDNVTGSCTLVQIKLQKWKKEINENYLVDFGLFQWLWQDVEYKYNRELPFEKHWVKKEDLNGLIITHPHADHFSKWPLLFVPHQGHKHFVWSIYSHYAARELIWLWLLEHVEIINKKVTKLEEQRQRSHQRINQVHRNSSTDPEALTKRVKRESVFTKNWKTLIWIFLKNDNWIEYFIEDSEFKKEEKHNVIDMIFDKKIWIVKSEKLFDEDQVESFMSNMTTVSGSSEINLGTSWNIKLKLYKSGHMIWATQAMISVNDEIWNEVNLLFTWDLGRQQHFVLPTPDVPTQKIDFMMTECTYWGQFHPEFQDWLALLKEKLKEVIKRRWKALFPCFKNQRMQDVLFQVIKLVDEIQEEIRQEINLEYKDSGKKAIEEFTTKEVESEIEHTSYVKKADIVDEALESKAMDLAIQQAQENKLLITDIEVSQKEVEEYIAWKERKRLNKIVKEKIEEMKQSWEFERQIAQEIEQEILRKAISQTTKQIRKANKKTQQNFSQEVQEKMIEVNKARLLKQKELIEELKKNIRNKYVENLRKRLFQQQLDKETDEFQKSVDQIVDGISQIENIKWIFSPNQDFDKIVNKKIQQYIELQETIDQITQKAQEELDSLIIQKVWKDIEKEEKRRWKNKLSSEERTKLFKIFSDKYTSDNWFTGQQLKIFSNRISRELSSTYEEQIRQELAKQNFQNYIQELEKTIGILEIDERTKEEILNEILKSISKDIEKTALKNAKRINKNADPKHLSRLKEKFIIEIQLWWLNDFFSRHYIRTLEHHINNLKEQIISAHNQKKFNQVKAQIHSKKVEKVEIENQKTMDKLLQEQVNVLIKEYVRKKRWKDIKERIIHSSIFQRQVDELKKTWDSNRKKALADIHHIPICSAWANIKKINDIFANQYSIAWRRPYDEVFNVVKAWKRESRIQVIEDIHRNPFFGKLDDNKEPVKEFPAILCASSWMIAWWMISSFLINVMKNPKNALFRVGYMWAKTPWRRIVSAKNAWAESIFTKEFWEIPLSADIVEVPCFSTHADQKDLETHIENIQFSEWGMVYANHWSPDRQEIFINALKANKIVAKKQLEIQACIIDQPIEIFPKKS